MSVGGHVREPAEKLDLQVGADPELRTSVLQELDRILASRFFRNSHRSQQFLEYIVRRKLDGRVDELKERTIGNVVFQRPPDYLTGEDPVVRVQAGEVRRRLEQFYQGLTEQPAVRIELTAGSYAPHFHLRSSDPAVNPEVTHQPQVGLTPRVSRRGMLIFSIVSLCAVGTLIIGAVWLSGHNKAEGTSVAQQFWAPALASQQPVLICLAKPVLYRPSFELYRKYSSTHPDSFGTEVERSNRLLPLDPQTKIVWSDMVPYVDYGVALGDVEAAVSISGLLGRLGKPTQVRIGDHSSFDDLHNSPSAVVGAFNNKWTMQITPGLHFRFVEEDGQYSIREDVPGGRTWISKFNKSQQIDQDFAIVARLLDSNTGQFTIVAAGLHGGGTQAAGEFVSKPESLEKAVRMLPAGWEYKSVEFVLQTNLTDAVAGPPSVVAYYTW
jgi:hypothetical protein